MVRDLQWHRGPMAAQSKVKSEFRSSWLCRKVILFTFELALSLFAQGCSTFFCGREKWWNWFDLMIICLSIMEALIDFWVGVTASSQGVSPQHLRFVRTVRLARALRGVRVMRLLRYVSALRTLVLSIMSTSAGSLLVHSLSSGSMASLLWTLAARAGGL